MNKGHIRLCSIREVNKYNNYEKKLFAVRKPGNVNYSKYGLIHVPELSPSENLFNVYHGRWKKGIFTNYELSIIDHSGDWFDLYKYYFTKEMLIREDMVQNLNRIEELLNNGVNILLVCFCPNRDVCHTKIIGEYFINKEYEVLID